MSQTQYPILPAQVILPEKLQAGAPQQLAAWHKPLAEPVLPKLGLAAAILAGSFFMDPTALGSPPAPSLMLETEVPGGIIQIQSQGLAEPIPIEVVVPPAPDITYPPLSEPVLPPERLLTANEWSFELDPEALATAGSPPAPSLMLETEVPGGIIQIQSQGLAEPIPIEVVVPAAPDITYPPLAEPVLPAARLQTANQWSFEVDDNLLATGGSPALEIHYPALSEPVLPPARLAAANEWSFQIDPAVLAEGGSPHLEIYYPPLSEPVLPAPRLLTALQRAFWLDREALATESDPQDTHYPPFSEPVLPEARLLTAQQWSFTVDADELATAGSPHDTLYPPLSEPVLPAPRLLAAISAGSFHFGGDPAGFVEPPHNYPDWHAPLAEPVIKPEYLASLQWSFEVDPDLLATGGNPPLGDPALEIKRLPLSEPVLPADRLQTANEWSFELDPAALATAGSPTYEIHYPPLSEPVLPAERLLTALQRAFWLDREALATESDPQDTHYPPFSEPVLPPERLLAANEWSFEVDTDALAAAGSPALEITYPALSEPVLPAPRPVDSDPYYEIDRDHLATAGGPLDVLLPPLSEPTLPAPRLLTALQWSFQVDPDLLATGGTPPPFDPAAQVFPPFSLPLPPPVLPEAVRASGWQNPATDPDDFVEPVEEDITTGRARGRKAHKPLRKIILPDGEVVFATSDQIASIRAEYEARVAEEGQAKFEQRRKEKGRRRAKVRRVLAEIQVDEGPPIPIPSSYVPTPKVQAPDINELIKKRLDQTEQDEEDAILLLVLLS